MKEKIIGWFLKRKLHAGIKALSRLMSEGNPEIMKMLELRASDIARRMCMQWLDNKRIAHCAMCPNTEQLLSINRLYYCAYHAKSVVREPLKVVA